MEHTDVLIIGAGISGVGMACRLKMHCAQHSFVMLEARDDIGGTWDLFRYPGIRSDSDMFTFGYDFKPWVEDADIATGPAILRYLNDTVDEYGLRDEIRFGSRVVALAWSSETRRWVATIEHKGGAKTELSCSFLVSCTGYYDYSEGYRPHFEGEDEFSGRVIHPQFWPEDLDYAGKRIAVIGSGATAVTLVPELSKTAAHVTMVQRTPTWIYSRPAKDPIALFLRKWVGERVAHRIVRAKNITGQWFLHVRSKSRPDAVATWLKDQVRSVVGDAVDVDTHFSPPYNPWDQRLCLVPDDDLFVALRDGNASIVTDHIERFTETGLQLKSGEHVDADIIVTATGLKLQVLGGATVSIDGEELDAADQLNYRGMMFGGIPNWVAVFGYTAASWTLKSDLTAGYVCRLLRHMRKGGFDTVVAERPAGPVDTEIMMENLASATYVQRYAEVLPKQGTAAPWRNHDSYFRDYLSIKWSSLDDGVLRFE